MDQHLSVRSNQTHIICMNEMLQYSFISILKYCNNVLIRHSSFSLFQIEQMTLSLSSMNEGVYNEIYQQY